jgi:MHS family proline/betaine transporter-like MFS transporter
MAAFASFGSGFIMRPLGAIICSHIGDRTAKGPVLRVIVILISIPTFMTGLLPDYQTIGILAPILITLFRMIQGFCVGPQFSGSIIYIAETTEKQHRGLHISITWAISVLGCIAGVLVCYIALKLIPNASWNWRLPFLLGIIPLVLSSFLKRHLTDIPKSKDHVTRKAPLLRAFKYHWLTVIVIIFLNMLPISGFYLLYVFNVSYLHSYANLSLSTSILLTGILQVFLCVFVIFFGYLSDRISNRLMLYTSCIGLLLLTPYCYELILHSSFNSILVILTLLTLLVGIYISPIFKIMPSLFPKSIRYSGFAFSYSIAAMLFGGLTPLIATSLIYVTHKPSIVAYMLSISALLGLIALLILRRLPRYDID